MINSKKKYTVGLPGCYDVWATDLNVYDVSDDDFYKGIWDKDIPLNKAYNTDGWYDMNKLPNWAYDDSYWDTCGLYPAVNVGDLVEVRETGTVSVVLAIGDNGMGDTVYQIHRENDCADWVQRPQIRKVL